MAGAPEWKVYDADGVYMAACKELCGAATLATYYGAGATIRYQHGRPLWTEGMQADGKASEDYPRFSQIVHERKHAPGRRGR